MHEEIEKIMTNYANHSTRFLFEIYNSDMLLPVGKEAVEKILTIRGVSIAYPNYKTLAFGDGEIELLDEMFNGPKLNFQQDKYEKEKTLNINNIFRYVILAGDIITFILFNFNLFDRHTSVHNDEILLIILAWILLAGNIYILGFGNINKLSFHYLSDVWPFITIKRKTLEERERIKRITSGQ
ncbi:MAG: hypothetical protein F8N36_08525 [Desulfovibrio sp.]|uniref:hypothetical protein n=1 Tax=Desulfovibrio sp. TaxID=885 RepID=UPI00135E85E2|nr:hypothetical protein [Desulfovibrio sp.]MTJ92890.1 hypothetical protein [Desulfovibrio sp.]